MRPLHRSTLATAFSTTWVGLTPKMETLWTAYLCHKKRESNIFNMRETIIIMHYIHGIWQKVFEMTMSQEEMYFSEGFQKSQIWRSITSIHPLLCYIWKYTPRKIKIAPEKWWLEDYFPTGKVTFQGLCYSSGVWEFLFKDRSRL